jgi:alkylation response protein AidB-like acyl-CoA dehydrogenase
VTTATAAAAPVGPSRSADFDLTPEQRQVRRAVREFAEREILPFVEEHEREERYPAELIRKLIPLGYLTPVLPEAYGGGGSDVVTYGVICEELARVDWVVASVVSVTNSLVAGSIVRFGTEGQRERWLPAICDGTVLTSACLTEPGGGSDLAAVRTRAVRTPGGWSLTGSKVFISHAAHAGLLLVAATVDPDARHRGVTVFLVDPRAEGVGISDLSMRTLKRDNLATIHFDRVVVPDDAVLGEVGGGFPILGGALDMGRFSVAARCVGQAQRAIDLTLPYARDREAFGQRIGEFQMVQQKIADMICRTESARALVYRLGRMKDAGVERCSMEASMAKLTASEAATANALDAIQIHGGYGFSAEYEVGRLLLEAKSLEVGEGVSELHRKLIAEFALGLRRQ